MTSARRAARAQVIEDRGDVLPSHLRSPDHPYWDDPKHLKFGAPHSAELMRHRAIDEWAARHGHADASGRADWRHLATTERGTA